MPIYEYECLNHKHRFEVIQRFADPPVTECTVCGEPVQKLPSSPAIQFKGTGWYITDYGRGGSSSEKSESKSSESKNSESKSSESKNSEPKNSESKASSESASTEKTSSNSSSKTSTKDKS